jgi:hypothetical protein
MTRMSVYVILALVVSCTLGLPRNDKNEDVRGGQVSHSILPLLRRPELHNVAVGTNRLPKADPDDGQCPYDCNGCGPDGCNAYDECC